MNFLPKLLLSAFTPLYFFLAPPVIYADWSTFRNNSSHQGFTQSAVGDLSPIHWTSENLSTLKAPPAVSSGGDLYPPTVSGLTKLNSSGQKVWIASTLGTPNGTPAIDNNQNIYFATSGCNPYVYSLTSSGSLRWQYDLRDGHGLCGDNQSNSAVTLSFDKQTLYVGVDYPLDALIAFNLDGSIKWKTSLGGQYPGVSSAAVADDGAIYVGTGGNGRLYALNASGGIRWYRTVASGPTVRLGTPLIGPDGHIYVTTQGASGGEYISRYDSSGNRQWFYQITGSSFSGEPAVKDNTVYIVESNHLQALDTGSGSPLWQWVSPISGNLTSPVADKNGVIYTTSGNLIFSVTTSGTTKSTLTLAANLGAAIIPADGLIYTFRNQPASSNGYLYSLGTTPITPLSYPVIFIPGIGGSELKANQDIIWSKPDGHGGTFSHAYTGGENIWVNGLEAAMPGEDDYFDVLKLQKDGQTPEADLSLTGNLTPFGYSDIDTFFEGIGYHKGTTYFVFPYDWRKDIRTTKSSLDSLIEEAKQTSGMPKVNIVAHSMGGLVAHNYIAEATSAAKVNKLIELGTPHLGSVDALKTLMYGSWLGYDFHLFQIGIPPSETKDNAQNLPAIFELLPSSSYFSFYDNSDPTLSFPFEDQRDIDSNQTIGTLNWEQTKDLIKNLNYNMSVFATSEQFHRFLDPVLNQNNGVKLYEIVGSSQPTLGQIKETWWISWPINLFRRTEENFINGDGTVPLYSASIKNINMDFSGAAKIYYVEQEHKDLVKVGKIGMNTVKAILTEGDTMPAEVKDEKITLEGQQISVDQDTNLDLYDESNNHTGLKSDGTPEENIPHTFYSSIKSTKTVFIKKSAAKSKTKVTSSKNTTTNIKIRYYSGDTVTKTALYKDVPVTSSVPVEFQIDPPDSTPPIITIGTDTLAPTSEASGSASLDSTPPVTTVALSGATDSSGYYTGPVTVTITRSDTNSGVLQTEYSLDNGQTVQLYSGPFTVSASGITTLQVYSTDKVGNDELPQTITFTILAPTPTPTLTPTPTTSPTLTSSTSNSATSSTSEFNDSTSTTVLMPSQAILETLATPPELLPPGEVLGVDLDPKRPLAAITITPFYTRLPWFIIIPAFVLALLPLVSTLGNILLRRLTSKKPSSKKVDKPKPK